MSKLGTGEFTNVKVLSDASAALRRSYRPTNQVLGEGMFGKVFIFTSRDQEEDQIKKYAVKIMLKQLMSRTETEDIRREI